jgi:hypothetical protein
MQAREEPLSSPLLPDNPPTVHCLHPDASDSASFDEVLESLRLTGSSLPHAVLMMIREAWDNDPVADPRSRRCRTSPAPATRTSTLRAAGDVALDGGPAVHNLVEPYGSRILMITSKVGRPTVFGNLCTAMAQFVSPVDNSFNNERCGGTTAASKARR